MIEYITTEHIEEARKKNLLRFGPIGEQVYKRTYSRKKVDGTQEDWYETAARVVNGNCNYVSSNFIEKDEPYKLFEQICKMELMPAGRHLWATNIGNKTAFLNNCFAASFTDNFTSHFEFTFMRLMEGGGVGANYSNLFIHSRNGTAATQGKPWVPKAPKNIHIVCDPDHRDYHSLIELAPNEDKDFPECIWLSEEQKNDYASFRSWKGETSKVQTYGKDLVTGEELSWKVLPPFVQFQSLLSKTYSPDWDPRVSNGEGPLYIRVEDSREGWTKALAIVLNSYINDEDVRDIVIDVSLVRPFGEALKGFGGKASGPEALILMLHRMSILLNQRVGQPLKTLDYMLLDHYIAMAVVSGGVRRSARMAMKYWKDEDVFDFITCKNTKPGEVPAHWTTNISIVIDNNFLRALKRKDPHATKVYNEVCTSMSSGNGEPGFVNASKQLEGEAPGTKFFTTNPSLRGTTKVLTDKGVFEIKDLEDQLVELFTQSGDWADAFVKKTGEGKNLVKINFTNGQEVYCTKEHKWPVRRKGKDYEKRLPKDIKVGDHVQLPFNDAPIDNPECKFSFQDGLILGWYYGDGWRSKLSENYYQYSLIFSKEDCEYGISKRLVDQLNSLKNGINPISLNQDHDSQAWVCNTSAKAVNEYFDMLKAGTKEDGIPESIWKGNKDVISGFVSGLFSADGCVSRHKKYISNSNLSLMSSREKLIKDMQALLAFYGINSYINSSIVDGFNRFELRIRGLSLVQFSKSFTLQNSKQEKVLALVDEIKAKLVGSHHYKNGRGYLTVKSVRVTDLYEDVYDAAVFNDTHTYMTESGITGNCGEITMVQYEDMYCHEVCCLGHINLDRVQNPDESFRLMTRFLIRATFGPVADPRQKENVERNRRIGVGIMGYHSWLCKNGLKYSDAPRNEEVKLFFRKQKNMVDIAAIEYANQLRIPVPIKKTTCAPTGSVCNLAGCTSSMQSLFSKFLIRRVQYSNSDQTLKDTRALGTYKIEPSVYAANTSVVEYLVVDPLFDEVVGQKIKQLNSEGITGAKAKGLAEQYAMNLIEDQGDLDIEDVLANQVMLQKEYVDNAISVTINVNPSKYTPEDVQGILKHYLADLKGVTMFPESSFPQSPLERITYEKVLEMEMNGYPVERTDVELACFNGACPIK